MTYTPELVERLQNESRMVIHLLQDLLLDMQRMASNLKSSKAQEYLQHGVLRRLKIIRRSVERVYDIFPPNRTKLLSWDELTDIDIHLHAFVLHMNGVFDNIAWVFVYENGLDTQLHHRDVGLFLKETQKYLAHELRDYLKSEKTIEWHSQYAKEYRDSLAHRIPLYLPPSIIDPKDIERYRELERQKLSAMIEGDISKADGFDKEAKSLESLAFFITHSFSETKKMIRFHAQLISDCRTLLEIVHLFRKDFPSTQSSA